MKLGMREIVFVALLTGIPLAAWGLVFHPQDLRNAQILRQIQIRQAKLRRLNQAIASLGSLKKEIASLHKAIAFFESKLPSEKEIAKVLQEVWRLAEANHLITKSVRPLDRTTRNCFTDPNGPHAEQPIDMQVEGNFMGFYAFLQALEDQPRIMRIHKMTLTKPDHGPEGTLKADFVVSIFFERADKDKSCRPKSSI